MLMHRSRAQRLIAEQGLDALFFRNAQDVTYASDSHNAGASLTSWPFAAVVTILRRLVQNVLRTASDRGW